MSSRPENRSSGVTGKLARLPHRLPRVVAVLIAIAVTGSLAVAVGTPLTASVRPGNDDFASAQAVGVAGTVAGTTAGATAQAGEPGTASGGHTVWFAWTPQASGQAFVVPVGRGALVRVRVYSGISLRGLRRIDRAAGGSQVLAAFDAREGATYRIQIAAATRPGHFRLQLIQPAAGAPPNDTPASAVSLSQAIRSAVMRRGPGVSLSGTTTGSTAGGNAVFYRWRVPPGTHGRVRVTLVGVARAARIGLGLFARGQGQADRRRLTLAAVPGRRYTLRVAGSQTFFELRLTPLRPFRLDTAPPIVTCVPPRGWVPTNAAVPCRARDRNSGLANPALRSFKLYTAVPLGTASASTQTDTIQVCDRAGNCAQAGPYSAVKVDLAPPSVTCDPVKQSGWAVSVTVDCRADDGPGGSGLARRADRSFTLTATLPSGHANADVAFAKHRPVCDLAGNCTPVPTLPHTRIDHSPPRISCQRPPAGRWTASASVSCTAQDPESGLATPGQAKFTLQSAVAAGTSSAHAHTQALEVCDLAGNCAQAGPIGPLKIDRQAPVVSCATPRRWLRGASASLTCHARDDGSGLANPSESKFKLRAALARAGEGLVQSTSRSICDRVGNCTTAGPVSVRLDDKPPTIACSPVPSAWQAGAVTVSCSATDGGSGVRASQQVVLLRANIRPGPSGRAHLPRHRFCDAVGNCASTPAFAPVRIDRQKPFVRCVRPRRLRYSRELTVRCHASDGRGAGLADRRQATFGVTTIALPGTLTERAFTQTALVCDRVGNCARVAPIGPFAIDLRPPRGRRPRLTRTTLTVRAGSGDSPRIAGFTFAR